MNDVAALRALATELRAMATEQATIRREKAACVLIAAKGLGLLQRKLGDTHG